MAALLQRYRAVKLLVALYGCKTGSVALRMLREIFGTKREQETRDWRKLLNEELYGWCFPTDIFRGIELKRLRCTGRIASIEEKTYARSVRWGCVPLTYPIALAAEKRVQTIKICGSY